MPTEMKVVCPHCGYDHEEELQKELDSWVSEEPYESECQKCEKKIIVHTHITFLFTVTK